MGYREATGQPQTRHQGELDGQLNHDTMFALRRKAIQSAGRLPAAAGRGTGRYSTAQHGKTGDEVHHFAGSSTEQGHHTAGPQTESLGVSPLLGKDRSFC
jgi:hypothetical protein